MDGLFINLLFSDPQRYFMWVTMVMFSICCHEYMHARAALWQGDETAAAEGHLTLNPIKQMGMFSIAMLMFIGISWGQVPVNPAKMRKKYSDALVSFAGPFANLVLFLLFCIGGAIIFGSIVSSLLKADHINHSLLKSAFDLSGSEFYGLIYNYASEVQKGALKLFLLGGVLNFVLFVFNMIPVPILDGYNIFSFIFPDIHKMNQELKSFLLIVVFIFAIFSIDILFSWGVKTLMILTKYLDFIAFKIGVI